MATLSKQGTEVGRLEGVTRIYSHRSNGAVLVNRGDGWKLAKLKPGATWADMVTQYHTKDPHFMEYRKLMLAEFPRLNQRIMAATAIRVLGDDIDGIWAELGDAGIHTDLETLKEIVAARKRWVASKAGEVEAG